MKNTTLKLKRGAARVAGFTLVELMVGMVIGLLATLVIMQVYATFEGQKRSTTSGSDAQTSGSVALFNIQRDGLMAGYGLPFSTANPVLNCADPLPTIDHDNNAGTAAVGMYPVEIVDGGAGSDTLTIRYGLTQMGGVPVKAAVTGASVAVTNNLGCQVNDVALLVNGSTCASGNVTALPDNTHITLSAAPAVVAGVISCMGAWNEVVYAVDTGMLTRNGIPSVADVVNIQAQYGLIAAAPPYTNNIITIWADAAAGAPDLTLRQRIRAVRVAVVARSGLYEKEVVSYACDPADPKPNQMCAFVGQANGDVDIPMTSAGLPAGQTWDHFRYRIFEVVIPMRNLVWLPKT